MDQEIIVNDNNLNAERPEERTERPVRVLACDTSNASCSCCLSENGKPLAFAALDLGLRHSRTFMPMVHDLMRLTEMRYEDLDFFACTVGPGSFTGIRIGVSAVQAMAFAAGKPAVPVSSLRALAFPLFDRRDALIGAMIDARNARVFSAAYYQGIEVVPEAAREISEFVGLCEAWRDSNAPEAAVLTCGNACAAYTKNPDVSRVTPMHAFSEIDPRAVAAIAEASFRSCDEASRARVFVPEALLPVYLTRTAAERNLEKSCKTE